MFYLAFLKKSFCTLSHLFVCLILYKSECVTTEAQKRLNCRNYSEQSRCKINQWFTETQAMGRTRVVIQNSTVTDEEQTKSQTNPVMGKKHCRLMCWHKLSCSCWLGKVINTRGQKTQIKQRLECSAWRLQDNMANFEWTGSCLYTDKGDYWLRAGVTDYWQET